LERKRSDFMWTHSGLFIEKAGNRVSVYVSDPHEFHVFVNEEKGELFKDVEDQIKNDIIKDGLYQCVVGYGSMTNPIVYDCRRIADINWNLEKPQQPEIPQRRHKNFIMDDIDLELLHKEIDRCL
jgi:hypothetical protein